MKKTDAYKINSPFLEEPIDLEGLSLIQIERHFCTSDSIIKKHMHRDFFELNIVNEGKGLITVNNQQIRVGKNDILVSFPFDTHGIISDKNYPIKFDSILFSVNDLKYNMMMQSITDTYYKPIYRVIQDSRINYLSHCIINEFPNTADINRELIKSILLSIIIYTLRAFKKKDVPDALKHDISKESICSRLINYIDTNIFDIERLQDIASATGYNYNYISTIFKQTTGITMQDYFIDKKLEIAHTLLLYGNMKIFEIAEKLHYTNADALSKAYKKKYGIPPSKHRES